MNRIALESGRETDNEESSTITIHLVILVCVCRISSCVILSENYIYSFVLLMNEILNYFHKDDNTF